MPVQSHPRGRAALTFVRPACEACPVPGLSWVSKTNVTDYVRCPYAFWLTDSGQVSRAELMSPFEAQLAERGTAFERGIVDSAVPIEMPPGGEAELFTQDRTILQVRTFRNPELRLVGRPDGLVTANGALEPVEIKAHRLLRHSDRIELAFYWLLLDPARTAMAPGPAGWVFLRRQDGSHARERVELPPRLLAEVEELIAAVRRARLEGEQPAWCQCTVCGGVRRREVASSLRERRDLSSVRGVGRVKREALGRAGYQRWEDILDGDAADITAAVNAVRGARLVSTAEVGRWQAHARALVTGRAVPAAFGGPFPVPGEYIAFDAEYTAANIWLLGARVVRPGGDLCFSWWASPQGEPHALSDLGDFLTGFPDLPVVTWNGTGADLPALRKAAARAGRPDLAEQISERHVDLLAWTGRNLMLPIPGLGLKEVSEHFGAPRQSGVSSGQEADMQWRRYQRTGDQALKAELITYNLDDLGSLVRAAECLRACAAGQPHDTAEPAHEVLESIVTEHEPGGPPAFRPGTAPEHPAFRAARPAPRLPGPAAAPAIGRRTWRQRLLRRPITGRRGPSASRQA
jgi:predicted RecB family nuclease